VPSASPVDDVADLTPAWLSAALGREVQAVRTEPIGHGQIGSNHRLTLTYADPTDAELPDDLPATLVAKLAAGEDRSIVSGGYRKEVAFYRDIAPTVAVRTPRCWHASMTEDATVFTLLLEDLAPAEPGDQLVGCTPEAAEAAAVNLAALHGPRWCDRTLWDHPEVDAVDEAGAAFLGDVFRGAVGTFVDRYRGRLDDDAEALLLAMAEVVPAWIQARPDRFTVLHGDYRLDNLLFDPDGAVSAVDWQTFTVGHPGRDLAYLVETSLEPEVRREHERALAEAHRRALAEHGVDLDADEAFDDLRLGLLQGPLITVLGAVYATAERSDRADAMFLTMLRRSLAAMRDLDPLALL
jgi:Phosphotransferase enzyme family